MDAIRNALLTAKRYSQFAGGGKAGVIERASAPATVSTPAPDPAPAATTADAAPVQVAQLAQGTQQAPQTTDQGPQWKTWFGYTPTQADYDKMIKVALGEAGVNNYDQYRGIYEATGNRLASGDYGGKSFADLITPQQMSGITRTAAINDLMTSNDPTKQKAYQTAQQALNDYLTEGQNKVLTTQTDWRGFQNEKPSPGTGFENQTVPGGTDTQYLYNKFYDAQDNPAVSDKLSGLLAEKNGIYTYNPYTPTYTQDVLSKENQLAAAEDTGITGIQQAGLNATNDFQAQQDAINAAQQAAVQQSQNFDTGIVQNAATDFNYLNPLQGTGIGDFTNMYTGVDYTNPTVDTSTPSLTDYSYNAFDNSSPWSFAVGGAAPYVPPRKDSWIDRTNKELQKEVMSSDQEDETAEKLEGLQQKSKQDRRMFAHGGDPVKHALRLARGGYADGGDPPDEDVPHGESLLMRESVTPRSLAQSWTPPEEAIAAKSPIASEFMQQYPQRMGEAAVNTFKYPGQLLYGEKEFNPEEASDWANTASGLVMTGGLGGIPARAGETVLGSGPFRKIGMGHNMPPSDETLNLPQLLQTEKRRGIDILNKTETLAGKDPQFSKFGAPLSDLETTISRKHDLVPYKVLSPEQLYREGAYIAPALGDLTGAGYMVHEINGIPLSRPVDVTGGGEYMRSAMANAQGQESAWASRPSTAQTMLNKINSQVPQGSPVYMSHTLMGVPSMDSSHMVMQGVLRQIPHLAERIDPVGAKVVDDFIRSHLPAKAQKDWPGIMNANAAEAYLMGKPGTWSSIVVKALDKSGAAKAGFPDVGATRFAMMEPRLVAGNQLSSGFALSRLDPSGKLISNPSLSHETYGGKMPSIGGYAGGFEHEVPMETMFSDWAKGRPTTYTEEKSGLIKPTTRTMHQQTMMTQVPVQKATQQWLDTVMGHMRHNPQKWGYLAGGVVKP